MPVTRLTCPECNATLKLANPVPPGKAVRCPTCKHVFRPPAEEEPAAEPEPVEEPDPAPATKKPAPAAAPKKGSQVQKAVSLANQAPARKPARSDESGDDEEDEREEEPQPRKAANKRRPKKGMDPAVLWGSAAGGIGLLLAIVLYLLATAGSGEAPKDPPNPFADQGGRDGDGLDKRTRPGKDRQARDTADKKDGANKDRVGELPPTGKKDALETDPAPLEQKLKKAIAGIKLVPTDFSLGGVDFTMDLPEGAKVDTSRGYVVYVSQGGRVILAINPNKVDMALVKRRWQQAGITGKQIGEKRFQGFLVERDNLALRKTTSARDTYLYFSLTATLGHLDLLFTNEGFWDTFSYTECLRMIHCAQTAMLKKSYRPITTVADLARLKATMKRDEAGKLTELTFDTNSFCTDATLKSVAPLARELTVLNLWGAKVSDNGLKHLAGMTALRTLVLPRRYQPYALDGSGLVHLKTLINLEQLDIGGIDATDADFAHLKELVKLEKLELIGTRITGTALKNFKDLTHLQLLDVTKSTFTDDGLQNLRGATKLRQLTLNGTKVTDAGLKFLNGMSELNGLYLDGTQVKGEGFAHLNNLVALRDLTLSKTPFRDENLKHLVALKSLDRLLLEETQVTGHGLVTLKGLKDLQTLVLTGSPVDDNGLQGIQGFANLSGLALGKTRVTDAGLKDVGRLPNLESLTLSNTSITDAGLAHLKGLAKLTRLIIENTAITDAGLEHLKGLAKLEEVWADNTKLTKAGVERLKKEKPSITVSGLK